MMMVTKVISKVLLFAAIAAIQFAVVSATVPACEEKNKCGRRFFKNKFNVRTIGTDDDGKQTCTGECVWLPRWKFRSGYECGDCRVSSIVIGNSSSDLFVTACTESTVEIEGPNVTSIQVGENFIYTDEGDTICSNCSPLFRKIVSIEDGPAPDSKILTTTFATFGDVFADDVVDLSNLVDTEVEPLYNCTYDDGNNMDSEEYSNRRMLHTDDQDSMFRKLQSFPNTCTDWFALNSDGRCQYTDCFVGTDGNPTDCFECTTQCNNSCGAKNGIKVSGDFGLFDFDEACCNHDHCYSSVYSQKTCDLEFLFDMLSECPIIPTFLSRITGPIGFAVLQGSCPLTALLFYGLTSGFGEAAYKTAQDEQENYEKTQICVAKCPTTQTSGGQGGTRLTIDLLEKSGTFPVEYEMYTIPDQLTITYEGKIIFDTGGLVSNNDSVDVTYSGNTTIIEAVVYAPEEGTEWDIFIGCPREP